jgi:hypothetical protein
MCVTRMRARPAYGCSAVSAAPCVEHQMSDDAKLGLILLFMVFALMVIGPVVAG